MSNVYYRSGELLREKNARSSASAAVFPGWAVDRMALSGEGVVLDVGCGWGRFAQEVLRRWPSTTLIAVDVWPGMVTSCRDTIAGSESNASFAAADACQLPFRSRLADVLMANHMLYEFEDPSRAITELARVVTVDGRLLATTYSDALEIPLPSLHVAALGDLGIPTEPEPPSSFSLENGAALLGARFDDVATYVLDIEESVADPGDLLEIYVRTGRYQQAVAGGASAEELAAAFLERASSLTSRYGSIDWVTRWTAFVAQQPSASTHS